MYKIYKITSPSGKSYIGLTKNSVESRWKKHCGDKRPRKLRTAINKYGVDGFTHTIIETCESFEQACELERTHIINVGSYLDGYNMTLGGDGVKGKPMSDDQKQRLSMTNKGKPKKSFTEQHKSNMSLNRVGIEFSDNHRANISKSQTGTSNKRACLSWDVVLPNGDTVTTRNRVKFCKDHELNYNSVNTSIQRNLPIKGYTFRKSTSSEVS